MPPRPKIGEGIVVVLDVGRGVCAGSDPTFLSQSKDCLRFILQRKIFADKCHDVVGIVTFGTAGTDNQLATGDQYKHVTVLQEIRLVDWDMIKQVENQGCGGSTGDWLDAVVVAMDLLHDPDGKRFTAKKIVLLTDFSGEFSEDKTEDITNGLLNEGIELVVIGPDVLKYLDMEEGDENQAGTSDSKNGSTCKKEILNWNGKPKSIIQRAGEAVVASIVSKVDGIVCTFDEALTQLIYFEKKKQVSACWNTTLDIGSDIKIPITGRIKVKDLPPPSWKKDYKEDKKCAIESEVSYHIQDEQQTAVDPEEVISGYFYGTTLVPVSDKDMEMTYKSRSPRSMTVLGFTESKNIPAWVRGGNQVLIVTARDKDESAAMALSAIIQALRETDMVAITRRIYSQNFNPRVGVMFPEVTKDHEYLLWIQIPFLEDFNIPYEPSLQSTIDSLTRDQETVMGNLIDAMDLSISKCKNEEDEEEDEDDELLNPHNVLDPELQYHYNILTHRALYPDTKLPPPSEHIVKILEPPERVIEARDKIAEEIKTVFGIKATPEHSKRPSKSIFEASEGGGGGGEKKPRVDDGEVSAGDLVQHQVTRVTTASPSEDFVALLQQRPADVNDVARQMQDVIVELVNKLGETSSGPLASGMTDKIIESVKTFRREIMRVLPSVYNEFLKTRFKNMVVNLSLMDLWTQFKEGGLGLITDEENLRSNVKGEEASSFLELETQREAPPPPQPSAQNDDLMDDLLENL